jgi:hypothetical protein
VPKLSQRVKFGNDSFAIVVKDHRTFDTAHRLFGSKLRIVRSVQNCFCLPGLGQPPGASLQIRRHTAFPVVATGALALVARSGQRRPVVSPTEPSTWIPSSSPRFAYQEGPQTTRSNIAGNRRTCYAKLLCNDLFVLILRGKRMGGDSNPRCLSAHTLSRRAQSTALSPIQAPHILTGNLPTGS